MDELPEVIETGLASITTVGAGLGVTVTVVAAEAFPPTPDATAVYIVVVAGLTACVPPLGCRVYVLPSDPTTLTSVAPDAVIVRMEELPVLIEVGLAVIVTVGRRVGITVSVALAEFVPPGPVATAVYVVVAAGFTLWLPPLGWRVYALPSVPVTVTWVASVAVTVKRDELPRVIAAGLTAIVTIGAEAGVTVMDAVADALPPAPFAVAV